MPEFLHTTPFGLQAIPSAGAGESSTDSPQTALRDRATLLSTTFRALFLVALAFAVVLLEHRTSQAAEASSAITVEGEVVSAANGTPLQGALVTDGSSIVVTGADGLFSFTTTRSAPTILIRAAGFMDRHEPFSNSGAKSLVIALEPQQIRALYLNPKVSTTQAQFERLIDVIDATSANAVVIDIKEEWVWYDTGVAFFREAGSVSPVLDLPSLLRLFHDHGIYTIARLVLFKDSIVAEAYPELAIKNIATGLPWRDQNGVAWVNPLNEELWEPNIDLAVEAAQLGFDEIQYDYVRFPTDGDLSTMDFGVPLTEGARSGAIEGYLARSRERLLPTGARQSADIFGFTLVVNDDLGIGQNALHLSRLVDYLSPMLYPSHYADHQFGLPGHPNEYPYDTVAITLADGVTKLNGNTAIYRPWLQDFGYPGMRDYTAWDVREQIRAADEAGTSGWMLWDPDQLWRTDRLDPARSSSIVPTGHALIALPQTTTRSRGRGCQHKGAAVPQV